jgi:hypothetical protein
MTSKTKREKQRLIQEEKLKLFTGDFYQEKEIGDKVFVKMWNGNSNKWQVAEFTKVSFRNYKHFQENNKRVLLP